MLMGGDGFLELKTCQRELPRLAEKVGAVGGRPAASKRVSRRLPASFEGGHGGETCKLCSGQHRRFPAPDPFPRALTLRARPRFLCWRRTSPWANSPFLAQLGGLTMARSRRHRLVLVVQLSSGLSQSPPRRWTPLGKMRASLLCLVISEAMFSMPSCDVKAFSLPQP